MIEAANNALVRGGNLGIPATGRRTRVAGVLVRIPDGQIVEGWNSGPLRACPFLNILPSIKLLGRRKFGARV
jgi:hypothetical protein